MSSRIKETVEQAACPSTSTDVAGRAVKKVVAADATKLGEIAMLLFRLQLLNLGNHAGLAGRSIAIDDGIILAPNPHRAPRTSAVSALIPDGIDVSSMLSVLDEVPMKHPGLAKAFATMLKAEEKLEAARLRAQQDLEAFVAALAPPQPRQTSARP